MGFPIAGILSGILSGGKSTADEPIGLRQLSFGLVAAVPAPDNASFAPNTVFTNKYTPWNFLPKSLFEQRVLSHIFARFAMFSQLPTIHAARCPDPRGSGGHHNQE